MRSIILFLNLVTLSLCQAQSDSSYYYFHRTTPTKGILTKIKNTKNQNLKSYYSLVYHSKLRQTDSVNLFLSELENGEDLPKHLIPRFNYFKAYYYRITQNDSLSFFFHTKALDEAYKIKDTLTILSSLSGLAQSYDYEADKPYRLDYLKKLEQAANNFNNNQFKIISSLLKGNFYLLRDQPKEAIRYYKDTKQYNFTSRDSSMLLRTIGNLGVIYNEDLKMYDSALYYYTKKLDIIENNEKFQNTNNFYNSFLNLGSLYLNMGDYEKAAYYTKLADSLPINESVAFRKSMINQNLSAIYEAQGEYKMAYSHFKEFKRYSDTLNRIESLEGIAKFENQDLRIKNLETEAAKQKTQNIAIGLASSLVLGSIIAFLLFKNTKRKQKLAEQEKEIESQKLETVLKEQELTAIDAMIEGQEKERQRIANDLHDDLGGLMANVKLHFNALKDRGSPELFDKTNNLIEEAYQKVRAVAHAKNSGVIAKQGLLKAVQNMADKISASNKIQIEVLDHGLDQRLENSLELTLFRIIQELVTNIIKHAQATEATIHLTNHDDSINIMIEDNGKGFNPSQVTITSKGMGISSIDKRVEHLDGKLTIESEKDKGTTVIIDIPL